ncbi:Methionine import ATP-binding protein metN 1 [Yersinia frederiksenii ATCC 33641]|nr:Methionine import ATP-binding protein metN 1 [Yersinia frederiksenii ATCC 33641]
MIELQHIFKTFERKGTKLQALNDVSLTIDDGDIFGIIGYSGAGKSTLLRMVNSLESPTSGNVVIDGKNLHDFSPEQLRLLKKNIGMIFQNFNLLESKTVFKNVAMPLILLGKIKNSFRSGLLSFWTLSGWEIKVIAFLMSYQAVRSSELVLHAHWRPIPQFYCAMKQHHHWIRKLLLTYCYY